MTAAQIRESVQTGKLKLSRSQKLNHYFPAHAALWIGLCLPGAVLFDFLVDNNVDAVLSFWEVLLFSLPWIIIAGLLYRHLTKVLSLSKIETSMSVGEIRDILVKLALKKGWSIQNDRKTFIVLKTNPGFTWNWGEKITGLLYKGQVGVNSICDPDFESAFYSSGRNRRNRLLIFQFLTGTRGFNDAMLLSDSEEKTG